MKAWVVTKTGKPEDVLKIVDRALPDRVHGTLRVRVLAAGVGLPDVLMCQGNYPFKPEPPFTNGQEVCGVITDTNGNNAFHTGQRVMGVTAFIEGYGGFGEEALVYEHNAFPVPADMSDAEAAVFSIAYRTGYVALVIRGQMKAGETLLVHGAAGGTGAAAIQLGKALGGRVIAVASGALKTQKCLGFGADEVVDSSREDFVERVHALTGGAGVDLIYDPVGGDTFSRSLNCLNFGGRLLAIGFASGAWSDAPTQDLVLNNRSVIGVLAVVPTLEMSQAVQRELYALYAQGKISPHIESTYRFEALPCALTDLAERRIIGRSVILMDAKG
ncbi:MAG: NADPH:quinone oxidoreductase family protein [Haliea sp.]|nr:NADPH:quinone oxidoreductase family protein [Haliea sp.]